MTTPIRYRDIRFIGEGIVHRSLKYRDGTTDPRDLSEAAG